MVRLLKIVYVNGLNGDSIIQKFDFPHYLSLDTTYIDNIRMFIRDNIRIFMKILDSFLCCLMRISVFYGVLRWISIEDTGMSCRLEEWKKVKEPLHLQFTTVLDVTLILIRWSSIINILILFSCCLGFATFLEGMKFTL